MISILAPPLSLLLIVLTFWFDYVGWICLVILSLFMQVNVLIFKSKSKNITIRNSHELSVDAVELASKFSHIYTHPFASRTYAGICGLNQFTGVVIACINAYHGIYWTIGLAVVNWYSLAYAAYFFNPLIWFEKSNQLHIHEEIVDHLRTVWE